MRAQRPVRYTCRTEAGCRTTRQVPAGGRFPSAASPRRSTAPARQTHTSRIRKRQPPCKDGRIRRQPPRSRLRGGHGWRYRQRRRTGPTSTPRQSSRSSREGLWGSTVPGTWRGIHSWPPHRRRRSGGIRSRRRRPDRTRATAGTQNIGSRRRHRPAASPPGARSGTAPPGPGTRGASGSGNGS